MKVSSPTTAPSTLTTTREPSGYPPTLVDSSPHEAQASAQTFGSVSHGTVLPLSEKSPSAPSGASTTTLQSCGTEKSRSRQKE